MTSKPTFHQIAQKLKDDPETFATYALGQEPTFRASGQVRYYPKGGLVVFTSGPKKGRWKLFSDDEKNGDMIDLCTKMLSMSEYEALTIAKQFLNVDSANINFETHQENPNDLKKQQATLNAKKIKIAQWIWRTSSKDEGRNDAIKYLNNRGITKIPPPSILRYRVLTPDIMRNKLGIPEHLIPNSSVVSLVFCAKNSENKVTAVQQILVTEGKKLNVDLPKFSNGIVAGSCVWLGNPNDSDQAIFAEGPETGLSIYQATGIPTAITLGTANYSNINVPANIKSLIIASDMEKHGAGLGVALKAAQQRNKLNTHRVGIALPNLNDGDFNDVLQNPSLGENSIRKSFNNAFYAPENKHPEFLFVSPDARAGFYAWVKTGIDVYAKPPAKCETDGKYFPLSYDTALKDHHKTILVVNTKTIPIRHEHIRKQRPDLEIKILHDDSKAFRKLARSFGSIEKIISNAHFYAPFGFGQAEPVFWSLTKSNADALQYRNFKSIALPYHQIETADFSFMANRIAIIAPIGRGTKHDKNLLNSLNLAGATTLVLQWQLHNPNFPLGKSIYQTLPDNYSATDAVNDGWCCEHIETLINIARSMSPNFVHTQFASKPSHNTLMEKESA